MAERALEFFANIFNQEQRDAAADIVQGPVSEERIFLPIVYGPPGTGKTVLACVSAVLYLAARSAGWRRKQVLIATWTHYAADQALRFLVNGLHADPQIVQRVGRWGREFSGTESYLEKYCTRFEMPNQLTYSERERLRAAKILICTIESLWKVKQFITRPLIILDEVSQVNVPLFLEATVDLRDRQRGSDIDFVTLIGDPDQLPIVTHQEELRESIIGFLTEERPDGFLRVGLDPLNYVHSLRVQYRMHPAICGLVNELRRARGRYPLESAQEANRTLLSRYVYRAPSNSLLAEILDPNYPLVLIDTSRIQGMEIQDISISNPQEARFVVALYRAFNQAYASRQPRQPLDGVIATPYADQKAEIRRIDPSTPVMSVEETQGREFDLQIFSGVRQNPLHITGFLRDYPRLYVMCSRPRMKLVIVVHRSTFERNLGFQYIFRYAERTQEGVAYITPSQGQFDEISNLAT
jgi:hypothetical protein